MQQIIHKLRNIMTVHYNYQIFVFVQFVCVVQLNCVKVKVHGIP